MGFDRKANFEQGEEGIIFEINEIYE